MKKCGTILLTLCLVHLAMDVCDISRAFGDEDTPKPSVKPDGDSNDTHQGILNETLAMMNAMASTIEGIQDKDSADVAVAKIKSTLKKMKEIKKRANSLPNLPKEKQQALMTDFLQKMQKVQSRLVKAGPTLIKYPKVVQALQEFSSLQNGPKKNTSVNEPESGKGNTHQEVLDDTIGVMNNVATAVESVKDEASAKTAVTKINAQFKSMQSIKSRGKKLPRPSQAVQKQIVAEYLPKMMKLQSRLKKAAPKLKDYPEVIKALEQFQKLMR